MKIFRMRCRDVSRTSDARPQACIHLPNVQFTLRSRKYYTRSPDRFQTRLPSKIRPKYSWSRTWISLHQRYHHVRRIFSTDGHCRWAVHHSVFRVAEWDKYHVRHHPSYLRKWLRTQRLLMYTVRLIFLIPLGYLPTPHCPSRCYGSRHTPNFTAIGASDGPDSGQYSSFKSFRSRRGVIYCYILPYSTTSPYDSP